MNTELLHITNEDCMELMARYPDKHFDLAIVDPPYEANDAIGISDSNGHLVNRTKYRLFKNIKPSATYFGELRRVSKNQIIWGGNFFGLSGGVIAWNKNGTAFGEGEIAICSTHSSVRFFEFTWNGMIQEDMKKKEVRIHPTQKPVALYKWILDKYAKKGDKILDTHMGSGSIAIGCQQMGFNLTACELDKEYYEAALKRIELNTSQTSIFNQ